MYLDKGKLTGDGSLSENHIAKMRFTSVLNLIFTQFGAYFQTLKTFPKSVILVILVIL
jgi:hypothetical protein